MKRLIVVLALLLAFTGSVRAQTLPFNYNNFLFFASGCSSYTPNTPYPAFAECFDTVTGAMYYWNTTSQAFVAPSSTPTSKVVITGATSGAVTLQSSTGTYNFNFPTTAGAIGALLTSGGGGAVANTNIWLPDVAAGQVLASGGTSTIPAFTASPTVTSLVATGALTAGTTITAGATPGTTAGCLWTVSGSGNTGTSAGTACLAACNYVKIQGYTLSSVLQSGGGAPTTLASPTSVLAPIACAQPSAGATDVICRGGGTSTFVISGSCDD